MNTRVLNNLDKKDINVMPAIDPSKVSQGVTYEFSSFPKYTAGIQKLVQRYSIILLTLAGSTFDASFGTDFMTITRGHNFTSLLDLTHWFSFANMDTLKILKEDKYFDDLPIDEQINTANLVKVEYNKQMSKALFEINIVSMAGNSYVYVIPVTV